MQNLHRQANEHVIMFMPTAKFSFSSKAFGMKRKDIGLDSPLICFTIVIPVLAGERREAAVFVFFWDK